MTWRVLSTARAFWVSGEAAEASLKAAGCEVVQSPRPGPIPEDELIQLLQDCDAVIASSDPYTARVFHECERLKLVARCGVGTDSVDMDAAARSGVVVTNTPGAMSEAVADFTFGLMLSIARRMPEADALMRTGGWDEIRGVAIYGKTLGLVGVGRIGQAVAKRAVGFGMRIIACDPILAAANGENPSGIEFTSLDKLLAESDFVSLHAPSTSETRGMFNSARFKQMKSTAYLINTARGSLINEADLIQALETEAIAGAALDVYDKEPLPADNPLRKAPRCVLTPHNAFNAVESTQEMSRQSAESVLELLRGEIPSNVCNPSVWSSINLRVSRR